jgi:hypothetical protein
VISLVTAIMVIARAINVLPGHVPNPTLPGTG